MGYSSKIQPPLARTNVTELEWITWDHKGLEIRAGCWHSAGQMSNATFIRWMDLAIARTWVVGGLAVCLATGCSVKKMAINQLGNALAGCLNAPTDLFAALGFVAVFAGAANAPLACTIMGFELFGATHGIYIAAACFLAYAFSGHSGIYLSQRVAIPKGPHSNLPPEISLRDVRTLRPLSVERLFRRHPPEKSAASVDPKKVE